MNPGRPHGSAVCAHCGLRGHYAVTCHVRARGADAPDRADSVAQELVPSARVNPTDLRRAVAAALRAAGEGV